ncbi:hypothetical protein SRABI98_00030 [Microbacterium sp. Bi98]|uniref:hypothetical protein n=1 Tax=Microbacterium sp. Bi98 TaxID=2821116 RepID=UPI001DDC9846|nr:hypothetical protein [Microbacterium sp. Bi98]CAH0123724.1 hypothetical protein SRABI98_00030 [Microbacterium sp. Bi98]
MKDLPLTSPGVDRNLAAIEIGHQLEGQQPSVESLDRARRILVGELSPQDARAEMVAELQVIVARERARKANR